VRCRSWSSAWQAGASTIRRVLAAFARPTRLYGQAVAYNSIGVSTRKFADVAALAADGVRGQIAFDKLYLLNAPGARARGL